MTLPTDAHWFTDSEDPRHPLKCPECGEKSPLGEWKDCEPYCEDCDNHAGIQCPKCDHMFDHVWDSEKFEGEKK